MESTDRTFGVCTLTVDAHGDRVLIRVMATILDPVSGVRVGETTVLRVANVGRALEETARFLDMFTRRNRISDQ